MCFENITFGGLTPDAYTPFYPGLVGRKVNNMVSACMCVCVCVCACVRVCGCESWLPVAAILWGSHFLHALIYNYDRLPTAASPIPFPWHRHPDRNLNPSFWPGYANYYASKGIRQNYMRLRLCVCSDLFCLVFLCYITISGYKKTTPLASWQLQLLKAE